MARLLVTSPDLGLAEMQLAPGCNRLGREGANEVLVPHPSVSRSHCELWLTEDAVLVRDLGSRNGTFVDGQPVHEAELFSGQTLRVGDVEMVLAEAPARISVPALPLPESRRPVASLPDGTPCCARHETVAAELICTACAQTFCRPCVRKLRVAGGVAHWFCPACGGPCSELAPHDTTAKRSWLTRIVDAFVKPPARRR